MCGKIRLVDLVVCYLWPSQIVIALVAKTGGQKSLHLDVHFTSCLHIFCPYQGTSALRFHS